MFVVGAWFALRCALVVVYWSCVVVCWLSFVVVVRYCCLPLFLICTLCCCLCLSVVCCSLAFVCGVVVVCVFVVVVSCVVCCHELIGGTFCCCVLLSFGCDGASLVGCCLWFVASRC